MINQLSDQQRAAAIIISVGSENASKIYKFLKEDDIEQLTLEIAKMQNLKSSEMEDILNSFYQLCLTQKVMTEGGLEYAQNVLEKAFGAQKASALLERVTKSIQTKAFDFIRKADYKNLLTIIQNEHPQTIALILSYSRSDQSSAIIAELPKEKQITVVERIARMGRTSPDVIKIVESNLASKFASIMSVDFTEIGGINYIADIMNHMDRSNERFIFDELSKRNAKLSDEIRKRMFVFEDITILDDMAIQKFIYEVDQRDLVYALKSTNQEVTDIIFKNMSTMLTKTIKSEMEYTHNVRLRDVEEAQQRIVATIRRLEEEGELVIMKGGKDDIIV